MWVVLLLLGIGIFSFADSLAIEGSNATTIFEKVPLEVGVPCAKGVCCTKPYKCTESRYLCCKHKPNEYECVLSDTCKSEIKKDKKKGRKKKKVKRKKKKQKLRDKRKERKKIYKTKTKKHVMVHYNAENSQNIVASSRCYPFHSLRKKVHNS